MNLSLFENSIIGLNILMGLLLWKHSCVKAHWQPTAFFTMLLNTIALSLLFYSHQYSNALIPLLSALNLLASLYALGFLALYPSAYAIQEVACLLFSFACTQGVFFAHNFLSFYIFFELSILPLGLWILCNHSLQSRSATRQFVLYTAIGSMLFLLALLQALSSSSVSFLQGGGAFNPLAPHPITSLFYAGCIFMPFLVKLPIWPLHGWLPLAHTQAPTAGSIVLASIILKVGAFGLMSVAHSVIHHETLIAIGPGFLIIGLISLLLMAIVAAGQTDLKKLIAYSSIVHMSWIIIGYAIFCLTGFNDLVLWQGMVNQLISHGLTSAGLFLCVGFLYVRLHTREISEYRGLGTHSPILARYWTFFMLANAALPGTSGFVGEFIILSKLYLWSPSIAALAVIGVVTGIVMNLRYYAPMIYGAASPALQQSHMHDCQFYEHCLLIPLVLGIIVLGVYPDCILHFIKLPGVLA